MFVCGSVVYLSVWEGEKITENNKRFSMNNIYFRFKLCTFYKNTSHILPNGHTHPFLLLPFIPIKKFMAHHDIIS